MQGLKHASRPELTAAAASMNSRRIAALPGELCKEGKGREKIDTTQKKKKGWKPGTASNDFFGRMIDVGSLASNMSLEGSAVRDVAESETDCSEALDEVVLGRIASLPLDPFPHKDFRGKFKKMRHKQRPTILESRYHFDSAISCANRLKNSDFHLGAASLFF